MRITLPLVALLLAFVPRAGAQDAPPFRVVHPLPPQAPPWREGFRVRWPVRVVGLASQQPGQSVLVALPTGGWLRPDASDLAVVGVDGQLRPLRVLSTAANGQTIVQFPRLGQENWYWVYGAAAESAANSATVSPAPQPDEPWLREGITFEAREWTDGRLDSWADVRAGLERGTILANGIAPNVVRTGNPARPDVPQQFATSHRGYLNVPFDGVYRFLVNGDGAAFLFIDGFKVFERPGANRRIGQQKVGELEKLAGTVELTAGPHAFEVHHAVGTDPQSQGTLALLWRTPDQPKFSFVPHTAFAPPLHARAAAAEFAPQTEGAFFVHGLDDLLEVSGLKLFLVRFQAHGNIAPSDLVWETGDGLTRTGTADGSFTHVYFQEGDFDVSVRRRDAGPAALPAFRRRIRVWAEPGEVSPLSLAHAVEALAAMDWKRLGTERVRELFTFLQVCEQPNRWPLLEQVATFLLEQPGFDRETRTLLVTARMESLAQQGRAAEALKYAAEVQPEFAKTPALLVRVQLATAAIHQFQFKDFAAASALYKRILDENSRIEHPNLRLAGVRWGDLFAETGDLERASQTYRVAATLGGEKSTSADADASSRGALLRIAEQKLRSGELLQTRQLLARLETEFPGRRLDGLYCFLRAETERLSGRYEDAQRHYEMIFRLPQWAGYRDRATFGIADSYLRRGDLDAAQRWLTTLKDSFPAFYAEKNGPDLAALLERRRARAEASAAEPFAGLHLAFEPDEREPWFDANALPVVRAAGIDGPHALLLDATGKDLTLFDFYRPLKNLVPGGTYVCECWWQDVIRLPPPQTHQQAHLLFNVLKPGESGDGLGQAAGWPEFNPGQWHKSTVRLKVPLEQDFRLRVRFSNMTGTYLVDRITIRPVSDRQLDALVNFLESAKGPGT